MMGWNRSWGWPFLEQPSHGSASVPNTGVPSGQCQGLPEPWRVAGVSVQQDSRLLQLPEHTGFMHQVAAPPTVQWRRGPGHHFMALGRSRRQGAVNSWQRCIFNLCSVSPQPHILSILFCHRIFMVGADFALTAVQHSHFTFPPTVKN